MILQKLLADVEARAGVSRAFQMILGASLLTNVFMAGAFFTMDRTVRTILVPPEISKTFWVDGRSIGPEYLEQMGTWVISLYATVSPSSIDYQNALLLKYVHPMINGDLSIRFKVGANRIKSENITKIFMPREVRVSEGGQAVALIGTQTTYIADKRADDEMKAYMVAFDYDGSRVQIKELREANPISPFDPPLPTAKPEETVTYRMEPPPPAQAQAIAKPAAPALPAEAGQPNASPNLPPAPMGNSPSVKESIQSGITPATPLNR